MGFLDRLFGRGREENRYGSSEQGWAGAQEPQPPPPGWAGAPPPSTPQSDDARAVERYRYLLRTAPPDQIERAHEEAFATLTPSQRQEVLRSLSEQTPPGERTTSDDPRSLARMATRAEMRHPGTLERSFGGAGFGPGGVGRGGIGLGGVIGGSLLGSVAGAFIGTAIAQELFGPDVGDMGGGQDYAAGDAGDAGDGSSGDAGGDYGGDYASGDFGGGGDFGDFGDLGGDF
ncbi:MAG: hypothetical protein ACLGIA_09215 [Actinomycetes bacterium]